MSSARRTHRSRAVLPEIHARPATPHVSRAASAIFALQSTAGNAAVQRLVRLTRPPNPPTVMTRPQRRAFVRAELPARMRGDGLVIIEDMAATSDALRFQTPAELRTELIKRVTMTQVMRDSQTMVRGKKAFGYPFTNPSLYWGPRVNVAAKDYWLPAVSDNYSLRRDQAKRRTLRDMPRSLRHTVFPGDQGPGYDFGLSPQGRRDPYEAIMRLFVRQPPHKRSLVHCDYLVSLVHFRAFMATLGKPAFNSRIAAYGHDRIRLRALLFSELEPGSLARPGLGSIRQVIPASPADLVVGDHVYFWNHAAYDIINRTVGNAWRLENAVLVERRGGRDYFLGHGSGKRSEAQMKAKLAREYNEVVMRALALRRRAERGSASARVELRDRFKVVEDAGTWWIRGRNPLLQVDVNVELRRLRPAEMPGLFNPRDTSQMYRVRRPIESS